jgi:hypothetical protein
MRSISVIKDTQGQDHTDILSIKKTLTLYFTEKYGHISVKKDQIRSIGAQIPRKLPTEANDDLEAQISKEEVKEAIKKGKRRKSPGSDGIGHEFYTANWDMIKEELVEIMRQMHTGGVITTQQKHGILVLIPKIKSPIRPENYRPLTLLNADIKILARIIAMRISKWLPTIIHRSQHCGIRGTSILDAVAEIRDVVAYAEYTHTKMCILTLDFRAAFDNIAHDYLYQILRDHGFSERAIAQIRLLYEGATASLQVNGHVSAPIPINCSIRQGCPLSMLLYTICLNPLINMLDKLLRGVQIDPRQKKTTTVAYADDVSIIITDPADIPNIKNALQCYQEASGAQLNIGKSKVMAIGGWDTRTDVMGIAYCQQVKILGITFYPQTPQTITENWMKVARTIRAQAGEAYHRDLSMSQRISYIHTYLLSRAWYVAQTLPIPTIQTRQISTTINWFIWKGAIFKVPQNTLHLEKTEGGWNLMDIEIKSLMLFLIRTRDMGQKTGTVTAGWLRRWGLHRKNKSPPNKTIISPSLRYLSIIEIETAYMDEKAAGESKTTYRKKTYKALAEIKRNVCGHPPMRIRRKWPECDWETVWTNIHRAPLTDTDRGDWYRVIHDLHPTNERLRKIKMSPTELCSECGKLDTIQHRITECGTGRRQWDWTKKKLASILHMDPRRIPEDWTTRPQFHNWPPRRHRAMLWLVGHLVLSRWRNRTDVSEIEYMDYLRRSRWKIYRSPKRMDLVGNYLRIIDLDT